VQGRPAKKAEAMLRDFIQSGGKVEWIELTDTCAKAKFSHPAGGSAVIDWTMERAKAAGIGTKDNWKKYPRQMLRSRVVSEGVRTVCPMATSGLYVPEEVADFEPTSNGDGGGAHVDTGEVVERQKVPGIHKIKERLSKLRKLGDAATDLDTFNMLVKEHKDDLKTIRDANHEWWTGDGEDFEGYADWKDRRKAELSRTDSAAFQFLVSVVQECPTADDLRDITEEYADKIAELDGEESRRFESVFNEREAALKNPTPMTAGAFGG
jgi:hypothetical protein